ncbi:MAG: hypothetical protein EXS09_19010 [Gemmataceae bacterium]|nr:hypothetical protein [Gemmataceae bacterium]
MSKTFQFEELDYETRDYLVLARRTQGKGVPGIFTPRSNSLPIIGILVGFGIMILTVLITFPPTDPPAKEAMLQTAGFLLGGWMVLAAIRVWMSKKHAGHFVYADAENLYEAQGGTIKITDLVDLRHANATQNKNYTDIAIKVGNEQRRFQVNDEECGRRVAVFLNAVNYMRSGGEDGTDKVLQDLSPEAMGTVAKCVVETGEFPKNVGEAEDPDVARVPQPRKEGRRSTGLLAIFATFVIGTGLFFVFKGINAPWRDDAVFERVQSIEGKAQAPALRLYLGHTEFTAHRDEAQKMLDAHYDREVQATVSGTDPDLRRGTAEVVLALKSKPWGVVTFIAAEMTSPEGMAVFASLREKNVQTQLADKWGSTIGDELVVFASPANPEDPAEPDKKAKGMIDLRWRFAPGGRLEYTIEFRKSPDEQPFVTKTLTVTLPPEGQGIQQADQTIQSMINQILSRTVGNTRTRPLMPPIDF